MSVQNVGALFLERLERRHQIPWKCRDRCVDVTNGLWVTHWSSGRGASALTIEQYPPALSGLFYNLVLLRPSIERMPLNITLYLIYKVSQRYICYRLIIKLYIEIDLLTGYYEHER